MSRELPLRIGIAGLGTVGGGVAAVMAECAAMLAARAGRSLRLVAVSARSPKPHLPVGEARFESDPAALALAPDIDVVVELIGGAEGIARRLVEGAIANGKHVVTANKALIATHGKALAANAEAKGVELLFEAAVAGGIPVVKTLREGLAGNRYLRISGILNGTCNYILTRMEKTGRDFAEVLGEAQANGYAEADPSFDVDGIDTGHKLAILAAIAFGREPDLAGVSIEGIRGVTQTDLHFARELGYRIKLVGIAEAAREETAGTGIVQRVHPAMIPLASPLARVDDVYNAVQIEGERVGRLFLEGRGAGAGPTASAVVADLIDLARGNAVVPFLLPAKDLGTPETVGLDALESEYYLRLPVVDRPGVLADVAAICRDHGISVASLIQHESAPEAAVDIVITTHQTSENSMQRALAAFASLGAARGVPQMIRIQTP